MRINRLALDDIRYGVVQQAIYDPKHLADRVDLANEYFDALDRNQNMKTLKDIRNNEYSLANKDAFDSAENVDAILSDRNDVTIESDKDTIDSVEGMRNGALADATLIATTKEGATPFVSNFQNGNTSFVDPEVAIYCGELNRMEQNGELDTIMKDDYTREQRNQAKTFIVAEALAEHRDSKGRLQQNTNIENPLSDPVYGCSGDCIGLTKYYLSMFRTPGNYGWYPLADEAFKKRVDLAMDVQNRVNQIMDEDDAYTYSIINPDETINYESLRENLTGEHQANFEAKQDEVEVALVAGISNNVEDCPNNEFAKTNYALGRQLADNIDNIYGLDRDTQALLKDVGKNYILEQESVAMLNLDADEFDTDKPFDVEIAMQVDHNIHDNGVRKEFATAVLSTDLQTKEQYQQMMKRREHDYQDQYVHERKLDTGGFVKPIDNAMVGILDKIPSIVENSGIKQYMDDDVYQNWVDRIHNEHEIDPKTVVIREINQMNRSDDDKHVLLDEVNKVNEPDVFEWIKDRRLVGVRDMHDGDMDFANLCMKEQDGREWECSFYSDSPETILAKTFVDEWDKQKQNDFNKNQDKIDDRNVSNEYDNDAVMQNDAKLKKHFETYVEKMAREQAEKEQIQQKDNQKAIKQVHHKRKLKSNDGPEM